MSSLRMTRWAAAAVLVGAVGAVGAVAADTPREAVEAAAAAQKLADGKAEAQVQAAIRDADRLAKTNKAKAAQVLRAAQTDIDLSAAVSTDARKTLTASLQARLNALDGKAPAAGAKADPRAAAVKADRKAVWDKYDAEVKDVDAAVRLVQRYTEANRKAEAARAAADIAAKYPDNPAVITLTQQEGTAAALASARELTKLQADNVLVALNSVNRAAVPLAGDVEYPKDWKTKKRFGELKLTPKEKELIESLDKPVTLAAKGRLLREVLTALSTEMGQELVIDTRSLAETMTDLDKPVDVEARGLSARTVLRQVLGGHGLTFVVKDQMIQVMTVETARQTMTTRVYSIGDIAQGVGPFAGPFTWGPQIDFEQTQANVKIITDAIKASIDPEAWKGGFCTITFHPPSMSLIVRASSEVHATLGTKLGGGR